MRKIGEITHFYCLQLHHIRIHGVLRVPAYVGATYVLRGGGALPYVGCPALQPVRHACPSIILSAFFYICSPTVPSSSCFLARDRTRLISESNENIYLCVFITTYVYVFDNAYTVIKINNTTTYVKMLGLTTWLTSYSRGQLSEGQLIGV
jgi:hypothetical protein